MQPGLDPTHHPALRSWVEDANGHSEFPIQNLPFGVFEPPGEYKRGGVAIGDHILDLHKFSVSGLLPADAQAVALRASEASLNSFLAEGPAARTLLRHAISALLAESAAPHPELLCPAADCVLHLPNAIGDYTDFYAGIHHARNVGKLFRPDAPLLPNYLWVPIGYHGRSSSVRVTGEAVRRPCGQSKLPAQDTPTFGPARNLDFELELGLWVGPGNGLGERIDINAARDHIAGYCLLNDWSARDLQSWEYQPLGPFLAKSFHTTISGWVVTPEALAPFRSAQVPRPDEAPAPLPYLYSAEDQATGALNLELEVLLSTAKMRDEGLPPEVLSRSHTQHLYWTPAQLLTHHASNGCNLRHGDLLGTGTISTPDETGLGSLLEITHGGRHPMTLPCGGSRTFLQDGDEVLLRAHGVRKGYVSIGFGECRAVILPSTAS